MRCQCDPDSGIHAKIYDTTLRVMTQSREPQSLNDTSTFVWYMVCVQQYTSAPTCFETDLFSFELCRFSKKPVLFCARIVETANVFGFLFEFCGVSK